MIVMPLGQAEDDHGDHRNKMNISKTVALCRPSGCENVHPGDDGDKREGDDPVLPAGDAGKIIGQIIGEEYGIRTAEKERADQFTIREKSQKSPNAARLQR